MNGFARSLELVLSSLKNKSLTQKEILEKTSLRPRTLRFALSRLKTLGLIEELYSLKDPRIKICRRR